MDPADQGHITLSANLASEPMSSTNRQLAQVDLLPFHSPLPINWSIQQWASGEVNSAEAQIQVPVSVNQGSYQALPMNNQSFQNDRNRMHQSSMPILLNFGHLSSSNRHLERQPQYWVQAPVYMDIASRPTTLVNKQAIPIRPPSKLQNIMSGNLGAQHSPSTNKRPAPPEPPQKARSELFESVRQKFRSSLAAALAVASEKQTVLQNSEKSTTGESSAITKQVEVDNQVGSSSSTVVGVVPAMVYSKPSQKCDEAQSSTNNIIENITTSSDTCVVQEPQPKDMSVIEEVPTVFSVVKDELLQGHGLCWVANTSMESSETVTNHEVKRLKVAHDEGISDKKHEGTSDTKEVIGPDSKKLAFRIEAELFKLFGGVNKKYKEKGRSLLFNLKDPNNPELRERVLSGEIAPERLCTMTAEELASKELSQWRQAKAEELAQMVMLPDSDLRRLVKKTHKGEFEVEMEQVDAVSLEVELGRNVTAQLLPRANEEAGGQSKSNRRIKDDKVSDSGNLADKIDSQEQNITSNLDNLLQEKADLMQELMEDEIKDPELLLPVISLDEFMQALDSEPPFEILSVNPLQDISSGTGNIDDVEPKAVTLDSFEPIGASASESTGGQLNSSKDFPKSKLGSLIEGSDSKSKFDSSRDGSGSKLAQQDISPRDPTANRSDKVDLKPSKSTDDSDSGSLPAQTGAEPSEDPSPVDILWEGLVQLNISSLATIVCKFKSAEKASTKEWPSFLEVKGRVRLDAFEKFLQELPLSRSRAIMIAQFVWKEGTPESGRNNLLEIVNSYIADNRVGFVEPVTGVELYLCPPHSKIRELLARSLAKEQAETLDSISDGLIGMVVWRRPRSTISPKMPSHHKHGNSKKQSSSRKQQSSKSSLAAVKSPTQLPTSNVLHSPDDDIDDVPPGFGPRDDDDLPEFDFVHKGSKSSKPVATRPMGPGTSHPLPNRPVDEIRQLIYKYGQTENSKRASIDAQTWNDDDDIPEWQPNQDLPAQPPHPQTPKPHAAAASLPKQQMPAYDHHQNQQPFQPNQLMFQMPHQQTPQALQPQAMPIAASSLQISVQPQLGMMQTPSMNILPGWQPTPWLPIPGGPVDTTGMPGIGLMQPSPYYSGQSMSNGQFFGPT